MKNFRALFGISAVAAAAVMAVSFNSSSASAAKNCTSKADCACQIALESGSRSAMRLFVKLYPRSDTACGATDSTRVEVGQGGSNGGNQVDHTSFSTPVGDSDSNDDPENEGDDNGDDNGGDDDNDDNGGDDSGEGSGGEGESDGETETDGNNS